MLLTKTKLPKLIQKSALVKQIDLTASLVVFENDIDLVERTIECLLNTPLNIKLCIIDNSYSPKLLSVVQKYPDIEYRFNNGKNLGFSRGHNYAFTCLPEAKYHLILNPDLNFSSNTLPELINYLEANPEVGLVSPKILFPDGKIQHVCRRYPSLLAFVLRRFVPNFLKPLFQKYLDWFEMKDTGYSEIMEVPFLSGCFMLFQKQAFYEIGGFDENMFLYVEDADITVRMAKRYKTIFYPHVHVQHYWSRGSYRSLRLALVHIKSILYFFNKHGWKWF